jgi:hypothetical protein
MACAAKSLHSFLLGRKKTDLKRRALLKPLAAENSLELWATELLQILAKFGRHLRLYPKAIYDLIPPFCPSDSILRRRFDTCPPLSSITVSGLSNRSWDESLAKFVVERGSRALRLSCADQYFAISTSSLSGRVRIFSTMTCLETGKFSHLEPISAL